MVATETLRVPICMHAVTSYELMESVVIAQAAALDAKAEDEGIESIAPLYGLPIPVKGTCATKLFPSCVGVGVLQHCYARRDSELCERLIAAGAVLFGKTNVPEFACSITTLNHTNGVCRCVPSESLSTFIERNGAGVVQDWCRCKCSCICICRRRCRCTCG